MTINWYPGHMRKANREMARVARDVDIMVEVLDARMPAASANPVLRRLRGGRPCIHVLNKADLADPQATREWINHFNSETQSIAIAQEKDSRLSADQLIEHCESLLAKAGLDGGRQRQRQVMIVGIPNVGKSTILNRIRGRKLARTGDEPAITRATQRVKLARNWFLIDTPGVLWPRLDDQDGAYRLACAGAIRNTAIEAEDVAFFAAEFLLRDFPGPVRQRYGLEELPATAEALLESIAGRRGCLGRQGRVDWQRVSQVLLNDYRSGKLGRMTLEQPPGPVTLGGSNQSPQENPAP